MPAIAEQPATHTDSGNVNINDLFTDATVVDRSDAADEISAEPEEAEAEPGDSDGEKQEQQEGEESESDETADQQLQRLAQEFGLDPNNPKDRKILDRMVMQDKRKADTDNYVEELKQKLQTSEFMTEWEKELYNGKAKPDVQQEKQVTQPATQNGSVSRPYGDGFDHWKSLGDGVREVNEAYKKAQETGDVDSIERAETALMVRRLDHYVMPGLQQSIGRFVHQALQDLKGNDLAPVLQERAQIQADRDDISDREFALSELEKTPGMKALLDELTAEGEETVTFNGKTYPASPIRRIFAENPDMLKMRVDHADPRTAAKLTWLARFRFAARQYEREKSSKGAVPVKQAQEMFKKGHDKAKQELNRDRIRQTVNAGSSKGKGRPTSADDAFIADISRSSGTTGLSASTLFSGLKR